VGEAPRPASPEPLRLQAADAIFGLVTIPKDEGGRP
jgi:hypothetical protein